MNLKLIKKRAAVLCLVLSMTVSSLTGCGNNTKLVFTTGLSGNQLFKIGSTTCTIPEVMIYLTTFYNQYTDTYGQEMWHYDFGGVSLEEHVKDVVLSKMAQIKIMNLMAKERGITLDKEEEKKILSAAECYYQALSEDLKKKENITEETVEMVYAEYTLANKVYAHITEAADMEISDDEARTVTVQEIYLKTWKMKDGEKISMTDAEKSQVEAQGKSILGRIKGGEDFAVVAAEVSDDKQLVKNYARGTADASLEDVLFSMDEGSLSDLIETSEGYYIVKCTSTMDYEATQENKLVLAEQRKKEAFSKAYAEVAQNTHSQFRDKQWEKLTLSEEIHRTEANFFEIYETYIKQ